jgi:hypothetical protein
MPEFTQKYNINSLYICLILLGYNVWNSNFEYINIILDKIYLLNYISFIIIINVIGIYLFLKNLSIDININCFIKYK